MRSRPAVVERFVALAERNHLLPKRNDPVAERNVALCEHDDALLKRTFAVAEPDGALSERNVALPERDSALAKHVVEFRGPIHAMPDRPELFERHPRATQRLPVSVSRMPYVSAERFLCNIVRTVAVRSFARVG